MSGLSERRGDARELRLGMLMWVACLATIWFLLGANLKGETSLSSSLLRSISALRLGASRRFSTVNVGTVRLLAYVFRASLEAHRASADLVVSAMNTLRSA